MSKHLSSEGRKDAKAFLHDLTTRGLAQLVGKIETGDDLMAAAMHRGYTISLQGWCDAVRALVIEPYMSSDPLSALRSPTKSHSAPLREWVYEVCDHEGDSAWSRDEDYCARVEYILGTYGRKSDQVIQLHLSVEQLNGIGWLPDPFGLCTEGEIARKLISWSKIKSLNGW